MNGADTTQIAVLIADSPGKAISRNVKLTNKGCTLFFNAQHHLLRLSPLERCFYDFLCEHMRAIDNDITINDEVKTKFQEHLMRVTGGKKTVTLNQLTKFVGKLSGLNLILKTHNQGRYIVNPKYAFKGGLNARKLCIKKLIEHRIKLKLPLGGLLHIPESEFLATDNGSKNEKT